MIAALIILATSAAAWAGFAESAAQCPGVRLDDVPGKPFYDRPVMSQDPMGLCWAFTTAQLVDGWRRTHPPVSQPDLVTSPFPIAAACADAPRAQLLTAAYDWPGNVEKGFNHVLEAGSCDHDKIWKQTNMGGYDVKLVTDEVEDAFKRMSAYYADTKRLRKISAEGRKLGKKGAALANYVIYERGAAPIFHDLECRLHAYNYVLNALTDDVRGALVHLIAEEAGKLDADRKFFDALCARHSLKPAFNEPVPKIKFELFTDAEGAAKRIRGLLARPNPQPVGIDYCATVLYRQPDEQYRGVVEKDRLISCKPVGGRDDEHASIIVGQRWDKSRGKCQFRIRNSWGSGCKGFGWPCDNGNFWVDEDAVGGNTMRVNHLE